MLSNKKFILILVLVFVLSAALVSYSSADAEVEYPQRAIQMVIPYSPGGGTDTVFRAFAQYANKLLDHPIVVVNMPGASATIGSRYAHEANPDGYTLFGGHNAMATTYVTGLVDFGYFDFEPVALLTSTPNLVVINPKYNDWETMVEIIEYAKENPGKVNWSVAINDTDHFFIAELFGAAEEDLSLINFVAGGGTSEQIAQLLGGHVDGIMANVSSAAGYVEAGELRYVGLAWHERLDAVPDLPTMDETGIAGFTNSTDRGIFAPKGTPKYVLEKIAEIAQKVTENPEFIELMEKMGILINFKAGDDYIGFLKDDIDAKQEAMKLIE